MFYNKILKITLAFLLMVGCAFYCHGGNADNKNSSQNKQKDGSKLPKDEAAAALLLLLLAASQQQQQQQQQQREKMDKLIRSIPQQCFQCRGSGWRVRGQHQCLTCSGTGQITRN